MKRCRRCRSKNASLNNNCKMVHCILYISIDQVSINSVLDESDTKVGYDTMNFASSQTTQPKVMDSSLFSSL